MIRIFISGTGTGVGKTWLGRGLAQRALGAGRRVVALKPIETGVLGSPEDALALGRACGRPELAFVPGLVRRRLAASPYAAVLAGEPPFEREAVLEAIRGVGLDADLLLVEGAGGLFVPLDRTSTTADLVRSLDIPVLLAAPNRLGVLSDTLATVRCAEAMGIEIRAIVLTPAPVDDSTASNAFILSQHLERPVHVLSPGSDDDGVLARAVEAAGLDAVIGLERPTTVDPLAPKESH